MFRINNFSCIPSSEISSVLNISLKNHKMLSFELLSEKASKPLKISCSEPGFILHSAEATSIAPHGQATIKTDVKMTFPIGYYGLLVSIPEILTNKGIEVISVPIWNGMNAIEIIVFNNKDTEACIVPGEMIGYLIVHKYYNGMFIFENKN